MAVRLPRLLSSTEITDDQRRPSMPFQRYWQSFAEQIERTINAIADILGITDQLDAAIKQAKEAAEAAMAAADTAQGVADDAAAQTAATKREAALQGSYIEPTSVLTASTTTITIAPHIRRYADDSSVAVNGGSVPATASNDIDYVSYEDEDRSGGAVTYIVSTTPPAQTGNTHVVGAVGIPATGTNNGGDGPRRPGFVEARVDEQ